MTLTFITLAEEYVMNSAEGAPLEGGHIHAWFPPLTKPGNKVQSHASKKCNSPIGFCGRTHSWTRTASLKCRQWYNCFG